MNEWQKPSKLGYSYEDVRGMDDKALIKAGLDAGDRLAAELANRLDIAIEDHYNDVLRRNGFKPKPRAAVEVTEQ